MKLDMDTAVHVMRRFLATPEAVFDAWVNPQIMKHWLFANNSTAKVTVENDPRVNGRFSIVETTRTARIDHYGRYLEIDRPNRLRFTLEAPKVFGATTMVTVDIVPAFGGCELRFIQRGIPPATVEHAWHGMFNLLETVLEEQAIHDMRNRVPA